MNILEAAKRHAHELTRGVPFFSNWSISVMVDRLKTDPTDEFTSASIDFSLGLRRAVIRISDRFPNPHEIGTLREVVGHELAHIIDLLPEEERCDAIASLLCAWDDERKRCAAHFHTHKPVGMNPLRYPPHD